MSSRGSKREDEEIEPDRLLIPGKPDNERCDNKVISARYTIYNFFFIATVEQFRRFANLYFLVVGMIMFIGQYGGLYETAVSPWTTLGPLAVVVAISLSVEATSDAKRHRNDEETNNAKCVILRRAEEINAEEGSERDEQVLKGKDILVNVSKSYASLGNSASVHGAAPEPGATIVKIGFQKVKRMDIRQGQIVLIKNREMVPADTVLLASSNDQGGAYIETSSIDGETNLKLRNSPRLPKEVLKALREAAQMDTLNEEEEGEGENEEKQEAEFESIEAATKRIARYSALGHPHGRCVVEHPDYQRVNAGPVPETGADAVANRRAGHKGGASPQHAVAEGKPRDDKNYVAALVTEPPNASVHTFSGKLTLPPLEDGGSCQDIPLGSENVLLRGAVLRNTEWAIGIACFTGTDTKLIQNSHKTPPKFSQLDISMNRIVLAILAIMVLTISYLSTQAVATNRGNEDALFYVGISDNDEPWPYLPNLPKPGWKENSSNWLQYFFLYITLLTNFVPLSLYVTVEVVTVCNLWFMYADLDMYDDTTNTRAVARSTIITDLGRIQYIFSDKTGTLTQNVMRFKRCSVDGMIFGAPVQKSRPATTTSEKKEVDDDDDNEATSFHPLRQLLVGRVAAQPAGLEGLGGTTTAEDHKLTFNAEMFLRVMSLCHTVVVEKDIDSKESIDASASVSSTRSGRSGVSSITKTFFGRKRANTGESSLGTPLSSVHEHKDFEEKGDKFLGNRARTLSQESLAPGQTIRDLKGPDGAPYGNAYQAESPDEGALVTAASSTFGFQVISRDTSGITLRTNFPSHLEDENTAKRLQSGALSLKRIAAVTANLGSHEAEDRQEPPGFASPMLGGLEERKDEKWAILAVNKFDSDRKRMSVLLRSPPELGSLPILFCKGADSAMLDPEICSSVAMIQGEDLMSSFMNLQKPAAIGTRGRDTSTLSALSEDNEEEVDEDAWEMAHMLGIQAHLGDFAKEGLRTLVLGVRILPEKECEEWLEEYKAASISLTNRGELLTAAAKKIERNLHIAGATAIEDKLQSGVPHTIAQLEKAGIKLWVLTGDKRETAVEIGYSTHVLTPKMHLTEVPDNGESYVRTQMAMEFIRLVKIGKLHEYQQRELGENEKVTMGRRWQVFVFHFLKHYRAFMRSVSKARASIFKAFGLKTRAKAIMKMVAQGEADEEGIVDELEIKRRTRARAEQVIRDWLASEEGKRVKRSRQQQQQQNHFRHPSGQGTPVDESDGELSLTSEEPPGVFNRATSARSILKSMKMSGTMNQPELRKLSIAHLTAQQVSSEDEPLVDEDTLSLESFVVGGATYDFDKRKRTLLERLFAIDREVRKGQLKKHMTKEKLEELSRNALAKGQYVQPSAMGAGPRALVIEGAALQFLLGDPELEEILFAVASKCDAVIACRVTPKQKALLVNLVRRNVRPEPVTLAIGDGANDVGMIQEAHVGVGISGKEGKQAVNASDFSISQFRFLEELILIHGRWNFFRLSSVVLFSFYKNAVMAGTLVVFTQRTLYSGTPLYDEWIIAMLNFVAAFPILFLGLFDRVLNKDYVKAHPEVYKATRLNELITIRTFGRWIVLVFVHIFTVYFLTVPQQSSGGGITSAFHGMMHDRDHPGDGEGGDLKSVGTVTFTCLIFLLAYKVLFEDRSLIHGKWPAFTCRKDVGEGFMSRLAWTWIGVTYLSLGFYLFAICVYQLCGRPGANTFSNFTYVTNHVLGTRSMSWLLITFVPISGMAFDVTGKVFSNMFYPTQTQIHIEIESKQKIEARKRKQSIVRPSRRRQAAEQTPRVAPPVRVDAVRVVDTGRDEFEVGV